MAFEGGSDDALHVGDCLLHRLRTAITSAKAHTPVVYAVHSSDIMLAV